jgi:D-alanyl-D-alanine carboxypeptidase/D-alanyl-D-alanine-endopeptidase (penicillin-binding protein 4)
VHRAVLPWMLAGLAAASGVSALVIGPSPAGAPRVTGVVTAPVLTPRRLPLALSSVVADLRLAQDLNAVLSDAALGAAAGASCMQVQVGGATVYDHRPGLGLVPASNQKLLTALAAVSRLGAQSRLTTEARAARPPVNGVVDGSLWLVGGGDPLLVTAAYRASQSEFTWSSEPASHLEELADSLKAAGVRVVRGGVIGDDSRYDRQRSVPSWKPSYLADGEIGAVGALIVNGGFASLNQRVPAAEPAATAADALRTLLLQRGIQVDAGAGAGTAPPGTTVVASLSSLPVNEIVKVMLKESDNLSSEMLVKELGHRFGLSGSWSAGLEVIRETLRTLGVALDGLVMVDGSGLDRGNRSRCATMVEAVAGSTPAAAAVDAGLPVAAREGTLVRRMVGQAAAGRLRAKTGSLALVAALTGFIDPVQPGPTGAGPAPAFALLANGVVDDAAGRRLEDRVAGVLAQYPQSPPPDALAPSGGTG